MLPVILRRTYTTNQSQTQYLSYKITNNICKVFIDNPYGKVNVINKHFNEDLTRVLDFYKESDAKSIIFFSKKPNNFIAGADINMLKSSTPDEISQIIDSGHQLISRLANINSICAIDGTCLGGGLEFALACKYRISTTNAVFGLPEVKLGLLPGMGGTQILPQLIGLKDSLGMILNGNNVRPTSALKMGFIDIITESEMLEEVSYKFAVNPPEKIVKAQPFIYDNPIFKKIAISAAKDTVDKATKGNYPAPYSIINTLSTTYRNTSLDVEKNHFCSLLNTPQSNALISVFDLTTENQKKYNQLNTPDMQNKIGIVGCGLMGTGIAKVSVANDIFTSITDFNEKAISHSFKNVQQYLHKKKLSNYDIKQKSFRMTSDISTPNFDVVIEAVNEDLGTKKRVIESLDNVLSDTSVIATNTSSLSVTDIAKFSKCPERVIGMHYFSPVEKMPLLEIVKGELTNESTLSKAIAVGKQQKKTIIVAKDRPGFYVNRCLAPYMNEAMHMLCEGFSPTKIDKIAEQAGFPIGPFTLMDSVGLDISCKVDEQLKPELFDRMGPTPFDVTKFMMDNNYLGKKNGVGFYHYKGKDRVENSHLMQSLSKLNIKSTNLTDTFLQKRLLYKFINESAYCLEHSIIDSEQDCNIGAIFGCGFPPFLGGPLAYIRTRGVQNVISDFEQLHKLYGNRFKMSNYIETMK